MFSISISCADAEAMWPCMGYSSTCRYFNHFDSIRVSHRIYIFDGLARIYNNFSFSPYHFLLPKWYTRARVYLHPRYILTVESFEGVKHILTALPRKYDLHNMKNMSRIKKRIQSPNSKEGSHHSDMSLGYCCYLLLLLLLHLSFLRSLWNS